MNFLAHLLLSCQDPERLVGNYLADFVKNRDLAHFPPGVLAGIRLHRQIDTFTDLHPVVKIATRRLRAQHSHYAPVCLDIFFDYLLCRHWSRYATTPLPEFCQQVYTILAQASPLMPPAVAARTAAMIADDWLPKYGTYEGIAYTFYRLGQRVSRPHLLTHAVDTLRAEEDQLTVAFHTFFPEIVRFVDEICGCHPPN